MTTKGKMKVSKSKIIRTPRNVLKALHEITLQAERSDRSYEAAQRRDWRRNFMAYMGYESN